ncbi:MAG: hypothetical protein JKX81_00240 [Arenicella sp.]|nr:hypothetical protein [Arenicella sp.]
MNILYRLDGMEWQFYTAWCGSHKSESDGWRKWDFSPKPINTSNANSLEMAFEYYIQASNGDNSIHYLIDDLLIEGHQWFNLLRVYHQN